MEQILQIPFAPPGDRLLRLLRQETIVGRPVHRSQNPDRFRERILHPREEEGIATRSTLVMDEDIGRDIGALELDDLERRTSPF